jgi:hypothetical protein
VGTGADSDFWIGTAEPAENSFFLKGIGIDREPARSELFPKVCSTAGAAMIQNQNAASSDLSIKWSPFDKTQCSCVN